MPTFDDIVKSISEPGEHPREYGWIEPLPEYLKIREHVYQRKPVIVVSGGAGTGKNHPDSASVRLVLLFLRTGKVPSAQLSWLHVLSKSLFQVVLACAFTRPS